MKTFILLAVISVISACSTSPVGSGSKSDQEASTSALQNVTPTGAYQRVVVDGINDAFYSVLISLQVKPCTDQIIQSNLMDSAGRLIVLVEKQVEETLQVCDEENTELLVDFSLFGVESAVLFIPLGSTLEAIQ